MKALLSLLSVTILTRPATPIFVEQLQLPLVITSRRGRQRR